MWQELEAFGVQVTAQVPAGSAEVRGQDQATVAVSLIGGVLELLRPQRVHEQQQRGAQQRQAGRQRLRHEQEGGFQPVELGGRPAGDLGQLVRELDHPRVVVGQAAEGDADLVHHPVADHGSDDRLGVLPVEQTVRAVQVRPQVGQHLGDQRPGRHRQPTGQHRLLHRRVP